MSKIEVEIGLDYNESAKQIESDLINKVKPKVDGKLKITVGADTKEIEKELLGLQNKLFKSNVPSNFSEPYKRACEALNRLHELQLRYNKLIAPSTETKSQFEKDIKAQENVYKSVLPKKGMTDYDSAQAKQLSEQKISFENQLRQAIEQTNAVKQNSYEIAIKNDEQAKARVKELISLQKEYSGFSVAREGATAIMSDGKDTGNRHVKLELYNKELERAIKLSYDYNVAEDSVIKTGQSDITNQKKLIEVREQLEKTNASIISQQNKLLSKVGISEKGLTSSYETGATKLDENKLEIVQQAKAELDQAIASAKGNAVGGIISDKDIISIKEYLANYKLVINEQRKAQVVEEAADTAVQKNLRDLQALENKLIEIQNKATSSKSGLIFGDDLKELSANAQYIFSNISSLKDSLDLPPEARTGLEAQIKAYEELYRNLQDIEKIQIDSMNDKADLTDAIASGRETSELKRTAELRKEERAQAQAINKVLDEKYNLTVRQNELLQKQGTLLNGLQISPNANLGDVQSGLSSHFGQDVNVKKLDDEYSKLGMTFRNFTAESKNADGTLDKFKGTVDQATGEVRILTSEVSQSGGVVQKLGDNVSSAAAQLFSLHQVFSLLQRFVRSSINYILDLDNALNEVRVTTGKSAYEAEVLGKQYNQMAKDMSVSTREIAQASVEFYRQGLGDNKVVENLQETIKFSKIAKMDMTQSAEAITAAMNSMDLSAQQVIDVYSYLGDATATSAAELATAIQKVGGTAAVQEIPFEKLSSWIAVVSSKTREHAETIGVSINSILSRLKQLREKGYIELENGDFENVNLVAKALTKANIDLIDKQTGQFRNSGEVLDEIGSKYSTLDENLQTYISSVLGFTHQQSRFNNLMLGYADSVDLYNKSLESAGIANEKFTIWTESSEASLNRFKATAEGMAQDLIDSDMLKGAIDGGTKLLEILSAITGFLSTPVGQGTMLAVMGGVNCHKNAPYVQRCA